MAGTITRFVTTPAPVQLTTRVQGTTRLLKAPSQLRSRNKWIGAKELHIDWMENPIYWVYNEVPGPDRCSPWIEVAELRQVWWLYILGKLDVKSLIKDTSYGAYLVFKLRDNSMGLDQAKALVRFLKDEVEGVDYDALSTPVFIAKERTHPNENGQFSHVREKDGWMEIQLGEFYVDAEDVGELHMQLKSVTPVWKTGLLVRGIEVRPK